MEKRLKVLCVILSIIIVIGLIFFVIDYNKIKSEQKVISDSEQNYADVFYATIEEIREYNGITTVLVKVLDVNDINHRGEFDFSIDNDTELLWHGTKIEISDLKEGQNISITSTGEVLERYPAGLTKVTRVIVLDDEL